MVLPKGDTQRLEEGEGTCSFSQGHPTPLNTSPVKHRLPTSPFPTPPPPHHPDDPTTPANFGRWFQCPVTFRTPRISPHVLFLRYQPTQWCPLIRALSPRSMGRASQRLGCDKHTLFPPFTQRSPSYGVSVCSPQFSHLGCLTVLLLLSILHNLHRQSPTLNSLCGFCLPQWTLMIH